MKSISAEEKADRQQFRIDYPMCDAAIKSSHKNTNQAFQKDNFYDIKQLKVEFLNEMGLDIKDYTVEITCENGFDKSSPNKYICRNHAHYKAVPKVNTHILKLQSEKEELLAKVAALESDLAYTQSRNNKLEKQNTQLQLAIIKIHRETEKNISDICCDDEVEAQSFSIN